MPKDNPDEFEFREDGADDQEVLLEYDVATYPSDFTLKGIYDMWNNSDISIPDFQREFVWTIRQSSLLIESFLSGLPVPPVFLYIDDENMNLVIDGQQRILSVVFFFDGYFGVENLQGRKQVFRLTGLAENSPFYKKKYTELDESDQRKLRTAVLRAINIRQLEPSSDNTSIYHIFERLNTGGTPLKAQEIRNCVFRGNIVDLLREMNDDENWRTILGKNTLDKHQRDIELVLRSFALTTWLDKYEKPMKEFLNGAMKRNRSGKSERCQRFRNVFPQTTKVIVEELGEKPFHVRGPLNTAVFDSVFCTVMDNLDNLPPDLADRFGLLCDDEEYKATTVAGTTDVAIVKKRFGIAQKHLLE